MGRLRGHKTTHGNHGTFEKPHVGYARAVLPPVDKNDNNSHVNLENLEEYFLQMIQKTLWNLNGMMALKNDDGPREVFCYACKETGHISSRCPKKPKVEL